MIDTLDSDQKQTLLRLLVEEVHVTGWNVQIRLRIPLDQPPTTDPQEPDRSPHPTIPDRPDCQAKTVCVPSVDPQRSQLPTQRPPHPRLRR